MKRLGIFYLSDEGGTCDQHVLCLLSGLRPFLDTLTVVHRAPLSRQARRALSGYAQALVDGGEAAAFQMGGYHAGLAHHGTDGLLAYDEVLLFDDFLFGPLYPLDEMFAAMDAKPALDFWGMVENPEEAPDPLGVRSLKTIPRHLQTNCIALRGRLLASYEFTRYTQRFEAPATKERDQALRERLTRTFADKGFRYSAYVDTRDLRDFTRDPLLFMGLELVKNRRCPFIKKDVFLQPHIDLLRETGGETTLLLFEYIQDHLAYDVDMILENLLRTADYSLVRRALHANYALPRDYVMPAPAGKPRPKIAFFMHLYYLDILDKNYAMIRRSIPEDADLYLTVVTEEAERAVRARFSDIPCRSVTVLRIENRGRDVSSLVIGGRDVLPAYDYVCFLHDKKTSQVKPLTAGESFGYLCFENTIASHAYVENIISLFDKHPRLGLLSPPTPMHANFYNAGLSPWTLNGDVARAWAEKLGLHIPFNTEDDLLAPLGTIFWFRPQALAPLFAHPWTYDDFPEEPAGFDGTIMHVLERLYGLAPLSAGYYTAWCMTDHYARIELTNVYHMLQGLDGAAQDHRFTADFLSTRYTIVEGSGVQNRRLLRRVRNRLQAILPDDVYESLLKFKRLFLKEKTKETKKETTDA